MKKYMIYHCIEMQHSISVQNNVPREYVGTINADNEEKAFELSNNIVSNWHSEGKRSTSVGDVIYDVENDDYMIVLGLGMMSISWTELGCQPHVEPGTKPDYIYYEGHRYNYSDELAAQIMATMPASFTTGSVMTLEQAKEKFGDDFVFTINT